MTNQQAETLIAAITKANAAYRTRKGMRTTSNDKIEETAWSGLMAEVKKYLDGQKAAQTKLEFQDKELNR